MDPKVLDYIKSNRISCLTTILKDGHPHGSTLHYCFSENNSCFYFLTEAGSRKTQNLPGKASLVIGFDEKEMATLQLEGSAEIANGDERKIAIETFQNKFNNDPSKLTYENIFLKFTPSWWRYTELKSNPPTTISSKDR